MKIDGPYTNEQAGILGIPIMTEHSKTNIQRLVINKKDYEAAGRHTTCPECGFEFGYNLFDVSSMPVEFTHDWFRCVKCHYRVNIDTEWRMSKIRYSNNEAGRMGFEQIILVGNHFERVAMM